MQELNKEYRTAIATTVGGRDFYLSELSGNKYSFTENEDAILYMNYFKAIEIYASMRKARYSKVKGSTIKRGRLFTEEEIRVVDVTIVELDNQPICRIFN